MIRASALVVTVVVATAAVVAGCGSRAPAPVRRESTVVAGPPVAQQPAGYDRVVAFVGQAISVQPKGLAAPATIEPPPTGGLTFDPSTGALAGDPGVVGDTVYRIKDAHGATHVVSVTMVPINSADRFVATTGDDTAAGDQSHPWRTIQHALAGATPGTTIFVATGRYHEDVLLRDLHGEAGAPIVIRSMPGELAVIDGVQAAITWTPATGADAAPDEWVSDQAFDRGAAEDTISRGVFVDREPYTRLLTYSRLEDLRAANQRWVIEDPNLPGAVTPKGRRIAWVYMGPGIYHDRATGLIHLRLSPTTNNAQGLADYDGPREPSQVALALWARQSQPVLVQRSSYVELHDLRLVGGGDATAQVQASEHVTFDHVEIRAATAGLMIGSSTSVHFLNGVLDGGIPEWSFRSDFKAVYKIQNADGTVSENNLVRKTQRTLLYVGNASRDIEVAYSELGHGHDIYFAGADSSIHHCRIGPIQDEALYVNHVKDIDNLRIHDNVYTRVVSGISSAGKPSGPRYVYRNIYDLRDPTASYRPGVSPKGVWRWGHIFKNNLSSAPFYFYHNTIAVRSNKPGQPVLLHFQIVGKPGAEPQPRWFADNVVVVAGSHAGPFSFVPADEYRANKDARGQPLMVSDGNAWVRVGASDAPIFRCLGGKKQATCNAPKWSNLLGVRDGTGFEAHSKSGTSPGFVRMATADSVAPDDDLRPGADSPAIGTAVALPADLPDDAMGDPTDAGALGRDAPPLRIGVDGRDAY